MMLLLLVKWMEYSRNRSIYIHNLLFHAERELMNAVASAGDPDA